MPPVGRVDHGREDDPISRVQHLLTLQTIRRNRSDAAVANADAAADGPVGSDNQTAHYDAVVRHRAPSALGTGWG